MKTGVFKNAIAVADVSSSMNGLPMQVSIALGILVSQCNDGPYANKIITFSDNPSFYNLGYKTLKDNVNMIAKAPWGGSTNMRAVFDLLINEATNNNIEPNNMIEPYLFLRTCSLIVYVLLVMNLEYNI